MYGQQSQLPPATKYFLDALGTGDVQMKTPDGADTVFAQKMQQGITQGLPQMQGMQGAKQDYAAAAPSVARNAQEAQMRQALQLAMQPKPAGIEGLPSNIRMAEGGVVGYSGEGPSFVAPQKRPDETFEEFRQRTITEQEAVQQKRRDAARAKAEEERVAEMTRRGMAPRSPFSQTPPAPTPQAPQVDFRDSRYRTTELRKGEEGVLEKIGPAPLDKKPEIQLLTSAQQAAPTGVAAALAAALAQRPTYDTAGIAAYGTPYIKAGEDDVGRIRAAEGKRAELEKTLPDLSAKGIAALQQRMRDVETAETARKENLGLDRVIQQLLGRAQGSGGAARADIQFMNNQRAAEDAFSQARLGNQQAQLLLEKAQQERQLGREDRAIALEKEAATRMEKARDDALRAQQIAQGSEAAKFQGAVKMRGDDIQALEGEANRKNALQVAGIQAAAREGAGDIAQKRLALQQLKADPEYTAAMNKIKELSKAAGLSSAPTVQAAFRTAQQEALAIARRYGLTPQDIGAAAAPAASAENDPLGIRK